MTERGQMLISDVKMSFRLFTDDLCFILSTHPEFPLTLYTVQYRTNTAAYQ